jgi:hypothetical protein
MNYIIADSIERDQSASNLNEGRYVFNLGLKGIMRNGWVGWESKNENLTYIRVHQFQIQVLPDAISAITPPVTATSTTPHLIANPGASNAISQIPSNIMTMEIQEIACQGIYQPPNNRYHFQFTVTPNATQNPTYNTLVPINDKYILGDLVNNMTTLTLIFRNPFFPVRFNNDLITDAIPFAYNLGGTPVLGFSTNQSNLLDVGDMIYVFNFDCGNTVINNYVTRQEGLLVGAAPIPSSTSSFSLNPAVDITALGIAPPNPLVMIGQCRVVIVKNRMRIPLMFGGLTMREMPNIALTP